MTTNPAAPSDLNIAPAIQRGSLVGILDQDERYMLANHFDNPTGFAPGSNACPTDAPRGFGASTITTDNGIRADFRWSAVPGATAYVVAVERFAPENVWVPFRTMTFTIHERPETYMDDGRYRARVRTHACGGSSAWSDYAGF